jgi:type I restriction enzyme S subunit
MGKMMEWPSVPLEELIFESKDGEWGEATEKSGYILCNIIRGTDFRNTSSTNIEFPQRYIKQHLADRKRLQPFDLLIETAGGTATQSTGKTVLVKESLLSGSGTPFLCSSFARYIRLKKDGVNPQFLQYFLEALYKNDYMRVYNTQHTGVSRFQWSDFKKRTTVPFPPAPVQVNIAAILSACDDLIENNNRRIAILEKMAEEIYREWFVRMRFPGHEKVKFHKGVPEGWEVIPISQVVDFLSGYSFKSETYRSNGKYGIVTIKNVQDGTFTPECSDRIDTVPANMKKHCYLKLGDVLMSLTGNVGRVCKVYGKNILLNQRVAKLKPRNDSYTSFIYNYFREKNIQILIENLSMGSTAQPNLSSIELGKQKMLLPIEKIASMFEGYIRPLTKKTLYLFQVMQTLKHSRDLLLSRLITGKLSVEDLDIKFPPSMHSPEPAEGREAHA